MKKKLLKYGKILMALTLIGALTLPSYATIGAADGSAFVTKAEFDAALSDFNARLTTFEAGINSKIDSQVSSYLDRNGIWNGKDVTITSEWRNLISFNAYGRGSLGKFFGTAHYISAGATSIGTYTFGSGSISPKGYVLCNMKYEKPVTLNTSLPKSGLCVIEWTWHGYGTNHGPGSSTGTIDKSENISVANWTDTRFNYWTSGYLKSKAALGYYAAAWASDPTVLLKNYLSDKDIGDTGVFWSSDKPNSNRTGWSSDTINYEWVFSSGGDLKSSAILLDVAVSGINNWALYSFEGAPGFGQPVGLMHQPQTTVSSFFVSKGDDLKLTMKRNHYGRSSQFYAWSGYVNDKDTAYYYPWAYIWTQINMCKIY